MQFPPGSLLESITCSDLAHKTSSGETPGTSAWKPLGWALQSPHLPGSSVLAAVCPCRVPEIAGPKSLPCPVSSLWVSVHAVQRNKHITACGLGATLSSKPLLCGSQKCLLSCRGPHKGHCSANVTALGKSQSMATLSDSHHL